MLSLLLACTPADGPKPGDDSGAPDSGDTAPPDTGDTADSGGPDPWADAIDAVERAVRRDLRANTASGASVAVWVDGEVVWASGFGTRHPDTEDPVETTTLFQIGSDTKKMTAIAALQQVQAGRLTLDSTVADVVPELVFASDAGLAGELALHELISHQGAIFDYTPWTDAPADAELYDRAVGPFAANEYALGPSGLFFNYSNPNFSLAGLLTQQADGRLWADILEDDLFAPLGLTRTFARKADVAADGDYAVGTGYYFPDGYDTFDPYQVPAYEYGTVELDETFDDAFTRPAGLVWSTATDMASFAGFLIDGNAGVIDDELLALVHTPHVPAYPAIEPEEYGYGYGLFVSNFGWSGAEGFYEGVPLWSHGGATMTMSSAFYLLPEQRVAVSVLSNGYGDYFVDTVVTALEAFAELPAPSATGATFLDAPEDVEALAGDWHDPHVLGRVTLTWDGAELLVSAPDLEAAGVDVGETLDPYAKDLYFLTADGVQYDFNRYLADDGAEYLVNRQFSLVRGAPETARPALPRPAPWLDRPTLGPLPGR